MKLNLIYAASKDGYIGKDGKLPWHIPEDLERFKWLTSGCPVIMGRKTWESLPAKVRPLPGRRNIVLTKARWGDTRLEWRDGFYYVANTIADSIKLAEEFCEINGGDHAWVIGGKEIYELFMPYADYIHVTVVEKIVEGHVEAPRLTGRWDLVWAQDKKSSTGIDYTDTILRRIGLPA